MPGWLRGDFHIHTSFSPDSTTPPSRLVLRCLQVGISLIAITDHNRIGGALETAALAPFQVIVGEEITTTEGEVTGLFLTEEVPAGLSPLETVRRIRDQGGLVSIPHPFDRVRRSVITKSALEEILPQTDIIEAFNARNTFQGANQRAMELAREYGLLVTAVSDAHHPLELGRTYTELPGFDGTSEGFKAALLEAHLVTKPSSPFVHAITTWNKLARRLRL